MQNIKLNSWEEFEEQLNKLEYKSQGLNRDTKILYRGHENHEWHLATTLERNGFNNQQLEGYHHIISVVKPQIETFTGSKWEILPYPKGIKEWLKENVDRMPHAFGTSIDYHDTYSYMVYLRHYGFPSPLLDWSSSPYIAAYFAFRNALQNKSENNYVSIYTYIETPRGVLKNRSSNKAQIYVFGPYIRTDRRHFLQQSRYTVCLINRNREWCYGNYEEVFARGDSNQDLLWKFDIPSSEGLKVLKLLDRDYNINAFSLFGTDDSLMETMNLREIHFKYEPLK